MKTIADVVRWIETEKPFGQENRRKILGSVRKMKKLPQYDVPLEQIPVDLEAFNKMWGSGPIRTIPRGFTTKDQFSDWRTQARSALTRFLDIPKHVSACSGLIARQRNRSRWNTRISVMSRGS